MKFLIADTETTGLTAPIKVVELGWILVDEELNVIEEFDSLINPERDIEPDASGIHNIRAKQVVDSPKIEEIDFPDGEICLICHRVDFDSPLLSPHMDVVAEADTLVLARRMLPDSPNHKLGTLSAYCNLPDQLAHRALGDCRTVLNLIDYLMEGSGMNLIQLINYSNTPIKLEYINFGKHRGIPFDEVPSGYMKWLKSLRDLDIDMKYTLGFY